ncbi:MAG: hypothetical protein K6U14_10795, partial [Firmicutes bacterium]|nr:hypothetical protein [Alicyclobacillaceae bacterium]MCL6498099.1 hypothetical protein [Bacillota bacterium]
MWTVRQLTGIRRLLREGIRQQFTTARDFSAWEAGVQDLCQQAARQLLAAALEQWDDRLWAEPGPAGTVVRKAPRKL